MVPISGSTRCLLFRSNTVPVFIIPKKSVLFFFFLIRVPAAASPGPPAPLRSNLDWIFTLPLL